MPRQDLINEIQKLKFERKEKEVDMFNSTYIFEKYKNLGTLFALYRRKDEHWHQIVRETLFADITSIQYMYNRTIQLIRRIGKDPHDYFEVKTDIGTYTLPDRLSDLNKLMELYEDLFCNILPGLTKKFNIEVLAEEQSNRIIGGKILWNKTIVDQSNLGLNDNPLIFKFYKPIARFDTPENILLIVSIMRLKYDATFLLITKYADPLVVSERNILEKIVDGCNRYMKLPILEELVPEARKLASLDLNNPQVASLERRVQLRNFEYSAHGVLVEELLKWRRMYRELYVRVTSSFSTHFPLDHLENIDTIYEIWVLFEMLDFLRSQEHRIRIVNFPKEFEVQKDHIKFTIFYEKKYSGWSSTGALPDFSIEIDGKIKAVLDAKNWFLDNKKDAIYKMLGYMNNLDSTIGVLFFPTSKQLGHDRIHTSGSNLNSIRNHCLFNCVLFPSPSFEGISANIANIEKIFKIIYALCYPDYQV